MYGTINSLATLLMFLKGQELFLQFSVSVSRYAMILWSLFRKVNNLFSQFSMSADGPRKHSQEQRSQRSVPENNDLINKSKLKSIPPIFLDSSSIPFEAKLGARVAGPEQKLNRIRLRLWIFLVVRSKSR